jgi:pimeloyl-ACP methyl ester carboxylesterase
MTSPEKPPSRALSSAPRTEFRNLGPRWIYLHGFASSPDSTKARHLAAHYATRGIEVERLDLRKPSFEKLRLSAMIEHVRERMGDARDRAVLIGSSLGGLTACRVAEIDARVSALVLMAPAFGLAKIWRGSLGEKGWEDWRTAGWLEVLDHATGRSSKVDFGFADEIARMDVEDGGFPDVRIPTLIIAGVRDDTVPVEKARAFARGKRHVRLIEVDDGHELTASLERVVAEADAFLAGFLGR